MPKISGSYYGTMVQPQFQTYQTAGMLAPATTAQPAPPVPPPPVTTQTPVVPTVPTVTTVGTQTNTPLLQGMMAPERESLIKAILMASPR